MVITMSSFFQGTDPDVDTGGAQASAQLAQDWAIKLDGPVEGTSYSSEYNANQSALAAQDSAVSAGAAAASAVDAANSAAALGSIILNDITDVNAPSPNDGEVLTWDTGTNNWVASAPVVAVNQQVADLWARIAEMEQKLQQAGLLT
jgi:hypothetical protein